jgi:D-sedoheptulose 7-phosphate isomerase
VPPEDNYTKYLSELKGLMDEFPLAALKRVADILFHAYENDHAIFLFGNGGSAALASHLATDLAKGTHFPGPPSMKNVRRMRVLALTDNTPLMTAWSNDLSYEEVATILNATVSAVKMRVYRGLERLKCLMEEKN